MALLIKLSLLEKGWRTTFFIKRFDQKPFDQPF